LDVYGKTFNAKLVPPARPSLSFAMTRMSWMPGGTF
jgi:hypothetical protein